VSGDHDMRPRRHPGPFAQDVAGLVESHVPQAGLLERLAQRFSPGAFLERRSWNFAEPDLILDGLEFDPPGDIDCRLDGRLLEQIGGSHRAALSGEGGQRGGCRAPCGDDPHQPLHRQARW